MAIGVATSNSILMLTFANEERRPDFGAHDTRAAALAASRTRLLPVLMTADNFLTTLRSPATGESFEGEDAHAIIR